MYHTELMLRNNALENTFRQLNLHLACELLWTVSRSVADGIKVVVAICTIYVMATVLSSMVNTGHNVKKQFSCHGS